VNRARDVFDASPRRALGVRRWWIAAAAALALPAVADDAALRHGAPLLVDKPAPFVELTLPAEALMKSARSDLADLRIVDARGQRTPFAWLPADAAPAALPQWRDVELFALPARGTRAGDLPASIEVVSSGQIVIVRRRADPTPAGAAASAPGWLFDLGVASDKSPRPDAVKLTWPAGAHFTATYRLETSDDLREWRAAGSGTVLALVSSGTTLEQPLILLPHAAPRFVRWTWDDMRGTPAPARAQARLPGPTPERPVARATLAAPFTPEPVPKAGGTPPPARSLHADLGGALPLASVRLSFGQGTQIVPARLQWRERTDAPWVDAAAGVFYRFERDGIVSESPALPVSGRARYLRLLPDERSAAPDPATARLSVEVELPRLVWAQQGTPPHRLLVGAAKADAGALPLTTLVPGGAAERSRFGSSSLGPFVESTDAAIRAERDEWLARWRPVMLWAVLLVGVAGLGFMVWRLAQSGPPRTDA
jgi:hypothetical protein